MTAELRLANVDDFREDLELTVIELGRWAWLP
jgi:hypothetical protein